MKTRTKGLAALFLAAAALAIVGPLTTAQAGHTNPVLEAELKGRNEVGTGGDPNGRGEAYVFGIDGDAATLCYVLTVEKISTATAAHIHQAPAGVNGPIVANLAAPGDGNAADCLTDGEMGKFPTAIGVQDILTNPAGFYVNVHNAEFPAGALRGQLASQGSPDDDDDDNAGDEDNDDDHDDDDDDDDDDAADD